MTALFVRILNMSITASVVALLMLFIRALFSKRLPATYCYLLQGIVFFRLLVPFSFPAAVSLFNLVEELPTEPRGGYMVTMDYLEGAQGYVPLHSTDTARIFSAVAAVWLLVAVLLLLYGIVTYMASSSRVRTAFVVRCDALMQSCMEQAGMHRRVDIYRSTAFDTPVVMGILRPRVILPEFMDITDERAMRHILTHELVHIRRLDHITKVAFTVALILHWFNPLVWLVYFIFGRDVEASCDEQVLTLLGEDEKNGYASSLVALCSAQKRFANTARLSFAESNIKNRVIGALDYHRLSRGKTILLSVLVLVVGIITSTNPVVVADGYTPVRHSVSPLSKARFESAVLTVTDALAVGNTERLLGLMEYSDPYYLPLYDSLHKIPLIVREYKLYPQSDELCYVYLRMTDDSEYTVKLVQNGGDIKLTRLMPSTAFEAAMGIEDGSEQVRFVRNLHRFGITTGFADPRTIPRPAVTALCIDEEYRDRVKSGQIPADTVYLPPDWIAGAARDYFGLENFSYTFDSDLYSSERDMYIYNPDRGVRIEASVIAQRQEGEYTLVTAQFYRDPLHLMVDKTITYRLKKK